MTIVLFSMQLTSLFEATTYLLKLGGLFLLGRNRNGRVFSVLAKIRVSNVKIFLSWCVNRLKEVNKLAKLLFKKTSIVPFTRKRDSFFIFQVTT